MQWCDFFDAFWDWSDSTRRTRISSLENIGSGAEVVDAVLEIKDPKVRAQLIRKAMKLGVKLNSDDFMNLDGELPDALYEQLGQFAGFDHNNPYLDEDNMTWDDFESCYSDWSEDLLSRRIRKLADFGDPEAISEVIMGMPTPELEDALYKQAVQKGVRFTEEQLQNMGHIQFQLKKALDNFATDEQIAQLEQDVNTLCKQLDQQFPCKAKEKPRKKPLKGCLQIALILGCLCALAVFVLIACILLLIVFGL